MKNMLEYKGYHAKVEYSAEDKVLYGIIDGIDDYVDFICDDVSRVEEEFHDAVDAYLTSCKEIGKEPDKEYKGQFNVRIAPELHRKLAFAAYKDNISLNAAAEKAIASYVREL